MGYNLGMTGVVGSGVSNDEAFPRPFDGGTSVFMHLISDSLQIYPVPYVIMKAVGLA